MAQQTALEWFWSKIALRLSIEQANEFIPELQKAKAMDKQESLELIKLTAQLTGVATVDEEIAKMEYIDVYNQYYNETYLNK